MSVFHAEFYRRYRPFYPRSTFDGLERRLLERGFRAPFQVADLGCGTGHSAWSLLDTGIAASVVAVDPDPRMLEEAKAVLRERETQVRLLQASAEQTTLASSSMDAAIVGSAFHWMNAKETSRELARILRPRGLVRIFEYQFPKAPELPALNEYVRRQFNLFWKAPAQVPRGRFDELTLIFRQDTAVWESLGAGAPAMELPLRAEEFFGLILSQSRVHHYESALGESERVAFHSALRKTLASFMGESPRLFQFKLEWVEFGRV